MTSFEKRCEDCVSLIKNGKILKCDECFGQLISDIDDCPLGIKIEEVEEAQAVKRPKLVGQSDKERKPTTRERKADEDKRFLVRLLEQALSNSDDERFGQLPQIETTNIEREIDFTFNNRKFKIVLSAPRK